MAVLLSGRACANCAPISIEGDIVMDMQQILSDEEIEARNVRLRCIGSPATDHVKLVYNAKHLDYLQNHVIWLAPLRVESRTKNCNRIGVLL